MLQFFTVNKIEIINIYFNEILNNPIFSVS